VKPDAQQIAIAEACGWSEEDARRGFKTRSVVIDGVRGNQICEQMPDYLNDLNAMHEVEKKLIGLLVPPTRTHVFDDYIGNLYRVVNNLKPDAYYHWSDIDHSTVVASAPQRCEAFLRTLNLWKES
jgi:hypothetical protein